MTPPKKNAKGKESSVVPDVTNEAEQQIKSFLFTIRDKSYAPFCNNLVEAFKYRNKLNDDHLRQEKNRLMSDTLHVGLAFEQESDAFIDIIESTIKTQADVFFNQLSRTTGVPTADNVQAAVSDGSTNIYTPAVLDNATNDTTLPDTSTPTSSSASTSPESTSDEVVEAPLAQFRVGYDPKLGRKPTNIDEVLRASDFYLSEFKKNLRVALLMDLGKYQHSMHKKAENMKARLRKIEKEGYEHFANSRELGEWNLLNLLKDLDDAEHVVNTIAEIHKTNEAELAEDAAQAAIEAEFSPHAGSTRENPLFVTDNRHSEHVPGPITEHYHEHEETALTEKVVSLKQASESVAVSVEKDGDDDIMGPIFRPPTYIDADSDYEDMAADTSGSPDPFTTPDKNKDAEVGSPAPVFHPPIYVDDDEAMVVDTPVKATAPDLFNTTSVGEDGAVGTPMGSVGENSRMSLDFICSPCNLFAETPGTGQINGLPVRNTDSSPAKEGTPTSVTKKFAALVERSPIKKSVVNGKSNNRRKTFMGFIDDSDDENDVFGPAKSPETFGKTVENPAVDPDSDDEPIVSTKKSRASGKSIGKIVEKHKPTLGYDSDGEIIGPAKKFRGSAKKVVIESDTEDAATNKSGSIASATENHRTRENSSTGSTSPLVGNKNPSHTLAKSIEDIDDTFPNDDASSYASTIPNTPVQGRKHARSLLPFEDIPSTARNSHTSLFGSSNSHTSNSRTSLFASSNENTRHPVRTPSYSPISHIRLVTSPVPYVALDLAGGDLFGKPVEKKRKVEGSQVHDVAMGRGSEREAKSKGKSRTKIIAEAYAKK